MAATAREAQGLFEWTDDGVAVLDARHPNLPIIKANRACRALLNRPGEAIVGRPWCEVFPNSEAHEVRAILRRVIATGEPFEARESLHQRAAYGLAPDSPDGLVLWNWKCLPIREDGGRVARLAIILSGTAGHHAEERDEAPHWQGLAQLPIGLAILGGADYLVR